jgi:hypothetical protein
MASDMPSTSEAYVHGLARVRLLGASAEWGPAACITLSSCLQHTFMDSLLGGTGCRAPRFPSHDGHASNPAPTHPVGARKLAPEHSRKGAVPVRTLKVHVQVESA